MCSSTEILLYNGVDSKKIKSRPDEMTMYSCDFQRILILIEKVLIWAKIVQINF